MSMHSLQLCVCVGSIFTNEIFLKGELIIHGLVFISIGSRNYMVWF